MDTPSAADAQAHPASSALDNPLPANLSARQGRDAYLAENDFDVAQYDAPYAAYPLWGLRIPVPNSARRRWAIRMHDLHHVALGFGTDNVGEGEISAWELRRGLRPLGLYVGAIVVYGASVGLLIAPRRTLRAFRLSGRGRTLFHSELPYEQLLSMSIGELRELLSIPTDGLAEHPRRRHALRS